MVAYVGEASRGPLLAALPDCVFLASRSELDRTLASAHEIVAVVEPSPEGAPVAWICDLRVRFPAVALVVYTDLNPVKFAGIAALTRAGFTDIVLRGYDDDRRRMDRLIDNVLCRLRAGSVGARVQESLRDAPVPLQRAVEAMFRDPQRYRTVHDLAHEARMSTRAVFRHVRDARFHSARRLVAGARVLRAFHLLTHRERTVRETATRLRYSSPDQLASHFVELVGLDRGRCEAWRFPGRVQRSPRAGRRQDAGPIVARGTRTVRRSMTQLPLVVDAGADLLQPFWDELARRSDNGFSTNSVAAGLVAMRVVNAIIDGEAAEAWGATAARRAADALPDDDACAGALRALGSSLTNGDQEFLTVAPLVYDYGHALENHALWQLAVPVYRSVLRGVPQVSVISAGAYVRLGRCCINMQWSDLAAEMFERAHLLAKQVGSTTEELLATMGTMRVAVLRGDFATAEKLQELITTRASASRDAGIRSRVLHDAMNLAHWRNDHVAAVKLGLEALPLATEEKERQRILVDLGLALTLLGAYGPAREVLSTVAVHGIESFVRWGAQINLMDLATRQGDPILFDENLRILSGVPLPPYLMVGFRVHRGEGLLRLQGAAEAADRDLQAARAVAVEFGLKVMIPYIDYLLVNVPSTIGSTLGSGEAISQLAGEIDAIRSICAQWQPVRPSR